MEKKKTWKKVEGKNSELFLGLFQQKLQSLFNCKL